MSEKFDYVKNISELTLEQKRKFYVLLAHSLTVSVRAIWSDENYSDIEKIEGMKWINEIIHRLIFRIEKLHKITKLENDSWTEEDFFQDISHWTSQNHEIVSVHIDWALKSSYKRCVSV